MEMGYGASRDVAAMEHNLLAAAVVNAPAHGPCTCSC